MWLRSYFFLHKPRTKICPLFKSTGYYVVQQSSWSKRAVEVESPQAMSPWDEAEPADSTCALVIQSRPEAQSTNWVPTNSARKCQRENDEPGRR